MMVDETPSSVVVQFAVGIAVDSIEKEAFKEVVSHQKENDERDHEDETRIRCQL